MSSAGRTVGPAGDPATSGRTVIIGAGPAGLTAAWELARLGRPALVLEKDSVVGGIARTAEYRGYRFDIGGHRFFTKVELVQRIWEDLLGEDFLTRPRLSRIFYRGKFFDYPLRPLNALRGLGPVEATRILASYMGAQLRRNGEERSFEDWVIARFGRRLYEIFFKSYTEKVWGIPCHEISADWAAQRIKNLDLLTALRHAVLGSRRRDGEIVTTLIDRFQYPRLGPGMMWERCAERLASRGIVTRLGAEVVSLHRDGDRILSVRVRGADGEETLDGEHFLSSMPLKSLAEIIRPQPPRPVLEAAGALRYRDFLTVLLIVEREEVFPDNWIYIHSPGVRVGRIQNFKNWSPDMVPEEGRTSLGLEYFLQEGDSLWRAPDEELLALAKRELALLGIVSEAEIVDGSVVRMPKAYPVYDARFRQAVATLRAFVEGLENLESIGRNGQHRYNNQDHSMLTAIYAARNIAGAAYDVWRVNVEGAYHEEARGDRLVPAAIAEPELEQLIAKAFARYDRVALGTAVGTVSSVMLLLATALLLVSDGGSAPTLSLLGNYLFGYQVSWAGAFLGAVEAGAAGFAFGWSLATAINRLVMASERWLRRRLQMVKVDPLEVNTT